MWVHLSIGNQECILIFDLHEKHIIENNMKHNIIKLI